MTRPLLMPVLVLACLLGAVPNLPAASASTPAPAVDTQALAQLLTQRLQSAQAAGFSGSVLVADAGGRQ